jgi:NAD(P)-dependent dehydrogenase (short-subunit alcohol dehydrogenase family)
MTTILITGANRGIGLELVRQYVEEGVDVLACCRKPREAKELQKLAEKSGKVKLFALDVGDPASIGALARELRDPIDILINNAGVAGPNHQSANKIEYEQWLTTFRINSMAPLLMAQAFKENLRRSHEKKIVTITSGLASIENNSGGDWYGYRASKAAVNSVMRGLAHDWAKDGILIGIFAPGWVRTDMGGSSAPLGVEQSVRDVRKRIKDLSAKTSGHYIDHTGEQIPW